METQTRTATACQITRHGINMRKKVVTMSYERYEYDLNEARTLRVRTRFSDPVQTFSGANAVQQSYSIRDEVV